MQAGLLKPDSSVVAGRWQAAGPPSATAPARFAPPVIGRTATTTEFRLTNGQSASGAFTFDSVGRRFLALARAWHDETDDLSVSGRIVGHPAYLAIVAMGRAAIPHILKDLAETQALWYPALEAITGESPGVDVQKPRILREAWLAWGQRHGYDAT